MSFLTQFEFFATCPRGLEGVLATELYELSVLEVNPAFAVKERTAGGVPFSGTWVAAFMANLYSRIASRILLKVVTQPYCDEHDIYVLAREQPWEQWFDASRTFRIDVTAIKSPLHSIEFTMLRIKDAICDRLRDRIGARPNIDKIAPDIRIKAFITPTDCTLYLDTSGRPLFKRGWRLDKGVAPLRENLAAGIIRLSGWTGSDPLFDPMCGSGTFIAEAAQIALRIAPGLNRNFSFEKFRYYDIAAWQRMKAQALDDSCKAISYAKLSNTLLIYASDISNKMLAKALENLRRASCSSMISLKQCDALDIVAPCDLPGVLVMNPPYSERISVHLRRAPRYWNSSTEFQTSNPSNANNIFFREFGNVLRQQFLGWKVFVFSSDRKLPGQMQLRASTKTPLYNGALKCQLFYFNI
ncbi:THUMP domain-containing class I SAM-dependent RNA methyltransferase [Candidatus Vallotia lariciata]|uniref:THUMP domain-containing class I SAM-dependent RNA methyltransferase n=1 Tax=Candidatus Vallotia laricis TaxID=2018052 RepID=UPI001D023F93|nr:class I SAM-dependent RNA methyltransferase [Candidatus Vallotia lariciata]UDG82848.1 Ribosomal RNA large subunit methyltransferase L [Candidatus Vallotia lariciata]